MIETYPLHWPFGWPRTKPKSSQFKTSLASARDGLLEEIRLLGGEDVILSSNMKTYWRRGQEIPYAKQEKLADCGVAVYFTLTHEQRVFACDRWDTIQDNIQSIRKTIEALRGIERWGSSEMLNRLFTGFAALPATAGSSYAASWWGLLGFDSFTYPLSLYEAAYKEKAKTAHPDKGGSDTEMARLNWAISKARGKTA
jgi:hypothetical protein